MIEIKPYRDLQIVDGAKGKTRIGGMLKTGSMAYAWHRHSVVTNTLGAYFLGGLLITVLLVILTDSPLWFILLGLVSLAVLLVINPLWQRYLKQYIGQPVMSVSSEHVARGDRLEIEFRQPFQRECVVTSITIHLIKREWVRYKCGTDICTDIRDVTIDRIHNRNEEQIAGGSYERRAAFQIPRDAMHSLALPDNHLIWLIRINLNVKDFMPLSETYAIHVTPEVHIL